MSIARWITFLTILSPAFLTGFADVTVMLAYMSVGTWVVSTFFYNLVMVADFLGNRRRIFSYNFSDFFELEITFKNFLILMNLD